MSLSIKIQKARRLIEKNGLGAGGKIVFGYLRDYARALFVSSGDILFITGGIGDKAHYRAFGVAEELERHGFLCAVTVSDNPRLLKLVDLFKVFIFHKVSDSATTAELVAEIKKQQKEIIFDTDDLDYDPQQLVHMDYFSKITPTEKAEYAKGIGAEILADPYVRTATTTVTYLAEKLRQKNKNVLVVSNKLSERELEIAEKIVTQKKTSDGYLRLGYYSGTPSHDKDFATVVPAVAEILEKYPQAKLVLAGSLDLDGRLDKFANRIEKLPRVPRDEYYANVAKCDINIVPLEMGNPFCEAKSEIKFIEAGILGIPTVAVRNRTFSEAISDAEDGFLAATIEEWAARLGKLIEDANLRQEMGRKARQKVFRDYTNRNSHSTDYYAYLEKILGQDKGCKK